MQLFVVHNILIYTYRHFTQHNKQKQYTINNMQALLVLCAPREANKFSVAASAIGIIRKAVMMSDNNIAWVGKKCAAIKTKSFVCFFYKFL